MGLCLAAAGALVHLGVSQLTLSWTHSVQKVAWEEDWRAVPQGLLLEQARVMGTGAGMEPPPEAHREGNFWVWKPDLAPLPTVILRRSGATDDWRLCIAGTCRPLSDFVPAAADPVELKPCA
ncbi:DUF1850 domain-containing protein [Chelatococcus asaccharovorans]|uniref:Uncharacterized protein DUF1850 n=1 Tax=Chelatococcus asaccharovorans TaxID=28210 RepID=A0A2V3TYS2_9HYPH|nr:DUF1850 domain-containing protein [Chelatococcus asaccharovorans]MBS7704775.1 DUF1850 domain-containing protein [Chelatococcus asaccharovorans]PXW54672.1 uncharacterized protein DUF1850 [Chelatococcus asaccharovorans]CAH1650042.1 conserved hypothetical protein [Chelatococcus asaccharovorans]CAH1686821.1 conserved hypothetical protein [Chelatococcus asaccharovorans]